MSSSEAPSSKDLESVYEVLRSQGDDPKEEIEWAQWSEVAVDLDKGKYQKRLLVVSRFRVLICKHNFFGKLNVEKNVPFLDIESILEQGGKVMVMNCERQSLEAGIKTSDVVGFLKAIRKGYRWMSTGISERKKLKFNVYKDLLVELDVLKEGEIEGVNGILNSYAACCNYLGRRQKETMRRYLKDLTEREIDEVILDDCPHEGGFAGSGSGGSGSGDAAGGGGSGGAISGPGGGVASLVGVGGSSQPPALSSAGIVSISISSASSSSSGLDSYAGHAGNGTDLGTGGGSATGGGRMDFEPLLMALGMNDSFTSIVSEYTTLDNLCMEALGRCLTDNRKITRIELVGAGITDISPVGAGLKQSSQFHQLSILNLSKNKLHDRGIIALASALESCTMHSMQTINLNDCEIGSKGMVALFDAFHQNLFFSLSIQALYIAGNNMNEASTNALLRWLRRSRGQLHLEYLSLARSFGSVPIDLLLGALAYAPCRLKWLDLSGIKFGDQERAAVDSFMPTLMGNSRLPPSNEFTTQVAIGGNQSSSPITSSPSPRHSIGLAPYAAFDEDEDLPQIPGSPALPSDMAFTLVLRHCQISADMMIETLLPALKRNKDLSRVSLDISLNDLTNTCLTMATALMTDYTALMSLRMSHVKMRTRTLVNFLNAPPPAGLKRLDISGTLATASSSSTSDLVELAQAFYKYLTSSNNKLTHLNVADNKGVMSTSLAGANGISGIFGAAGTTGSGVPTTTTSTTSTSSSPSSHHCVTVLSSILLALFLPSSAPVKSLDISNNAGLDAIGHVVGDLLRVNQRLQSLRLDGNLIGFNGWQSIYAGLTQPKRPNATMFDMPIPTFDLTKATKTLPYGRQQMFLSMLANLKATLDRNTPKEVLTAYLTRSVNSTPTMPWPSVLKAMDADAVDAVSSSDISSKTSMDVISAATAISDTSLASGGGDQGGARPSSMPSSSSSSKTVIPALLNPRASVAVPPSQAYKSSASRKTLGMGAMSRASMALTPETMAELGFASTPSPSAALTSPPASRTSLQVPGSGEGGDELIGGRGRRGSVGPVQLAPASVFFAVGGGASIPTSLGATPPTSAPSFAPPSAPPPSSDASLSLPLPPGPSGSASSPSIPPPSLPSASLPPSLAPPPPVSRNLPPVPPPRPTSPPSSSDGSDPGFIPPPSSSPYASPAPPPPN